MGRNRDRDRRVHARELLDGDGVRHRVGTGAPVRLRDRHAHEPELGELADEFVREAALPVQLLRHGCNPLLRKRAHRRVDELVLLIEIEVQLERLCASSTISRTPYPVPPRCVR